MCWESLPIDLLFYKAYCLGKLSLYCLQSTKNHVCNGEIGGSLCESSQLEFSHSWTHPEEAK